MSPGLTPGDTAPDQVARLLALVPYVHARGEVRVEEAAAHFGTDPAQIDRDLRVLFMTGLPGGLPDDLIEVDIEALEGEGVIRLRNADYLSRPVRFAPAEATALVVALRTMLDTASGDARAVVQRTLDKLEAVAGTAAQAAIHVQAEREPGAEAIPTLQQAIERGHQLEISYHVPARDEETTRVVDPRAVATVDGVRYLDAWCHRAAADRVFRVDRIVAARELDSPVADPAARPRDLTERWFTEGDATRVTLRLGPPAHWVREYYPVLQTRPGPDGTIDVDLEAGSEAWLRQLLLRLAPHASVVEPQEFAESFLAAARSALRGYAGPGVGSGVD